MTVKDGAPPRPTRRRRRSARERLGALMDRCSRESVAELTRVADDPLHPWHAKHGRDAARTLEQLGLRPRAGSSP